MVKFEKMAEGISLLKIPFEGIWVGIYLVEGGERMLIDSGLNAEGIDTYLIPALNERGLKAEDISVLLSTHTHGDHVGGHHRFKELNPNVRVVATKKQSEKLVDPLKYNVLIRQVFPEDSPPPSAHLKGVSVDEILEEGGRIDRLTVLETAGHDSDSVCFYDEKTRTLLTGDSLQQDGTNTQGCGLYMDLAAYRASLRKLMALDIEKIVCGHPFNPLGAIAEGKAQCREYLNFCLELTDLYDDIIKDLRTNGKEPREIATQLIRAREGIVPKHLFLALYTVTQHLKLQN